MKASTRLTLRKVRSHIPQFIGLILLLVVGVCFFITLFTVVLRFEETAELYFTDNSYADVTFYGKFDNQDVEIIREFDEVLSAQGRVVRDFRLEDIIIRAVSLTEGINTPHIYEGGLPENKNECVILKRNADVMGCSIGDIIKIGNNELIITGLIASPEYVYLVKNERAVMAQAKYFGVIYVPGDFFAGEDYNEIVVTAGNNFAVTDASQAVRASRSVLMREQLGHIIYRSDLDEIRTFAYIFPFVFAVLIAVVIYVTLSRTIQKDRKQIGIMKALGTNDKKIISLYLSQFCFAALIGSVFGGLLSVLVCDFIISIFGSMFVVPALSFRFYPLLWVGAIVTSIVLCALSGMIALLRILPLLPAHAMRPRIPKGGRRLLIERVGFLWEKLSFNTRYALKNSLRNKSRFLAVVLGMCGSGALMSFSFGFADSINNTQERYFNEFADYDLIINFEPMPLMLEHSAAELTNENQKALVLHVEILDENYMLVIAKSDFDMVKIPANLLQSGVIIPEYFAAEWGAGVGSQLEINGYMATVSAIVPQYMGLAVYTSFDYISTITDEVPPGYNTIYARSNNLAEVAKQLSNDNIEFTTIDDDRTNFDSIMESMEVLIWFMIGCSIILGFTVLYSVGLINLSAREYEYMFMGVMGYPHRHIMSAHIKETILQLLLAIPLSFVFGNIILTGIKGEFSGSGFVLSPAINSASYLLSALAVIVVTVIMGFITSRHIKGLDITKGLKAQED